MSSPSDQERPQLPTAAELDILVVIWRLGVATVREVHDALQKDRGYTTTLKQMQMMTDRGLLRRTERFGSHVYQAAAAREQTRKRIAADLLDRAFDGSARELVLGALSARKTSAAELGEIQRMIEEFVKRKGEKL